MSENGQREGAAGAPPQEDDAFAPTQALDAIPLATIVPPAQGQPSPADTITEPFDDGRTVPMTSDQVSETLARLEAEAAAQANARRTHVESADAIANALAVAQTVAEQEFDLPEITARDRPAPAARTIQEHAIPPTQQDVSEAVQQAYAQPPAPAGTSKGLIVAIACVAVLIVAGLAFVVFLAMR